MALSPGALRGALRPRPCSPGPALSSTSPSLTLLPFLGPGSALHFLSDPQARRVPSCLGAFVQPPHPHLEALPIIPLSLADFHSGFVLDPSCFLRMSLPTS